MLLWLFSLFGGAANERAEGGTAKDTASKLSQLIRLDRWLMAREGRRGLARTLVWAEDTAVALAMTLLLVLLLRSMPPPDPWCMQDLQHYMECYHPNLFWLGVLAVR